MSEPGGTRSTGRRCRMCRQRVPGEVAAVQIPSHASAMPGAPKRAAPSAERAISEVPGMAGATIASTAGVVAAISGNRTPGGQGAPCPSVAMTAAPASASLYGRYEGDHWLAVLSAEAAEPSLIVVWRAIQGVGVGRVRIMIPTLNTLHRLPASSTVYDFQISSLLSDGVCSRSTSLWSIMHSCP
jgi:hypothetical protein